MTKKSSNSPIARPPTGRTAAAAPVSAPSSPKVSMVKKTSPKSYRDAVHASSSDWLPSASDSLSRAPSPDAKLSPAELEDLQRKFPTRVVLSSEKFAASAATWQFALVGRSLGRELQPEVMTEKLTPLWSSFGEWDLFPMSHGFFVFRFSSPEARDQVLYGGPWVVDGAVLALSLFDPSFRPSDSQLVRVVLWVRMPDLPPAYWSEELITDILAVVGRVLRLDDHTASRSRGRYARAAVEVDLRRPLLPGVTVDVDGGSPPSFWQQFQYEHVHIFCSRCRRIGHRLQACRMPLSDSSSSSPSPPPIAAALSSDASTCDWTTSIMVRRRRQHGSKGSDQPHRHQSPARAPLSTGQHGIPCADGPKAAGPITAEATVEKLHDPPPRLDVNGPGVSLHGPKCPSHTLASGLKHLEPLCSTSSSMAIVPSSARKTDGGFAINGVDNDEHRLIQEILMDDTEEPDDFDVDDDVVYTTVGKKKKGKGKIAAICLRPAPRNRVHMKRAKTSTDASSGSFSLLQDLMGDATPAEIAAKYGPSTG